MTTTRKAGRPRAASRQLLEEAACELFLEQGFATTSVAQITSRAGVSRSTFFNYFETKSDLLWATFDELVAELPSALRQAHEGGADQRAAVTSALHQVAHRLPADNVALAFSQDAAMGLGEELSIAARAPRGSRARRRRQLPAIGRAAHSARRGAGRQLRRGFDGGGPRLVA